jgi:hypothetical protein
VIRNKSFAGHDGTLPALRRLRQEYHKFKASLSYIARPCLKKIIKSEVVSLVLQNEGNDNGLPT